MKTKNILIVAGALILFTVLVIGATYAWWSWQTTESENTTVNFVATETFACSADGGGNITTSTKKLVPTHCTNSNYAIQRKITTNITTTYTNENVKMSLWLDVINIDSQLLASSNFKYAVTTNPNSCTSDVVLAGASFNSRITNNKAPLFTDLTFVGTQSNTYYLYIWLDEAETDSSTMNRNFNLALNGQCTGTGV